MKPHEQMIISALRYALDRKSYIMSATEDYIRNMKDLSKGFIYVAMRDIADHQKECIRLNIDQEGMHDWEPLYRFLEGKK